MTVSDPFQNLLALAPDIHASNIAAGWWKQEPDPVPVVLAWQERPLRTVPRNIGELLCLVHSEISEANVGWAGRLPDDKLPHRQMVEVEFADTAIRALDILGYYLTQGITLPPTQIVEDQVEPMLPVNLAKMNFRDAWLLVMHRAVSDAMEGFRKGNVDIGCSRLIDLVYVLYDCAETFGMDLMGSIAEKRAFNASRADHQLENRAKADGKKF